MSLDEKRARLLPLLERDDFSQFATSEWAEAKALIAEWWAAYKAWESTDTFEKAFYEQRMTIRWCNQGLDYSWSSIQAKPQGKDADTQDYFKQDGASKFGSNVGMKGILDRMDPKVFVPSPGEMSQKNELGLHDLSASILKNSKSITSQLHNAGSFAKKTVTQIEEMLSKLSEDNKTLYYAFMPLSKPADQKVFHLLNDCAKAVRNENGEFYTMIRDFRSKMTRVKLACEHDMSSGFLAKAPDSRINPKFKYGHQPTTKLRVNGLLLPNRANTDQVIQTRKNNAMNYDLMLERARGVNEISIAYRSHASREAGADAERFPMLSFCTVNGKRPGFQVFSLTQDGQIDAKGQRFIDDMPLASK